MKLGILILFLCWLIVWFQSNYGSGSVSINRKYTCFIYLFIFIIVVIFGFYKLDFFRNGPSGLDQSKFTLLFDCSQSCFRKSCTVLLVVITNKNITVIAFVWYWVGVWYDQNAPHNARGGAGEPSTRSRACSSVTSAAGSACACLRGIMVIKPCALATTTGRPRKEDPSALKPATLYSILYISSYLSLITFIFGPLALLMFLRTILCVVVLVISHVLLCLRIYNYVYPRWLFGQPSGMILCFIISNVSCIPTTP